MPSLVPSTALAPQLGSAAPHARLVAHDVAMPPAEYETTASAKPPAPPSVPPTMGGGGVTIHPTAKRVASSGGDGERANCIVVRVLRQRHHTYSGPLLATEALRGGFLVGFAPRLTGSDSFGKQRICP